MDPFIGELQPFAFGRIPSGWLPCDGRLLQIQSNPALFSLLGTTYGGDGRNNFNLPDLRGRLAIGMGQGQNPPLTNRLLAQQAGVDYMVIGRPVTQSADPAATLRAINVSLSKEA